jgi:transcriptional regulator with XRE-family HTH domain
MTDSDDASARLGSHGAVRRRERPEMESGPSGTPRTKRDSLDSSVKPARSGCKEHRRAATLAPAEDTKGRSMADDVGARLKAIREMYGYSQRELAKRAKVTNGTISLIELSQTSPQVASLRKILSAFPMSIAEFFTFDLSQTYKAFYEKKELVEISSGGSVSLKMVGADCHGRRIQLCHERFAPGSDTGKEKLSHKGEEAGVVVRGHLEVTVGNQKRILGPGDGYYFSSRIPHRFRNLGNEECEVVSAATPPTF